MRCAQIMKRDVRTIAPDDDLLTAARAMRDADVGFLPVCDARGVAVGVVTDRDIVVRACAEDTRLASVTVGSVMTRGVTACAPDDPLSKVVAEMRRHHVLRVLVLDARGAPVGVISLSDIAQYEMPSRVGRTLQSVAERKYAPERP
jgi:CBS domain-containing protein